jgi:urease accessory protein
VNARRLAGIFVLLSATPACAHTVIGIGGFPGGLLHPILVPAHLFSLLALGLLISQQRERVIASVSFIAALVIGLIALTFAVGETAAPSVMLANTALAGVMVAAAWTPPKPVVWLLAAITGGMLALDSPPDAVTIEEGNLMLVGTALGACATLVAVVAGASLLRRPWQRLGVRIAGSWIAASALLVLALELR